MLGLPAPPQRIEGFDISNISGTFMVASMVSFGTAGPTAPIIAGSKSNRSKQDDFACMAETIRRRYARLLRELASGDRRPEAGAQDRGGEASPAELQRAVDDVSRVMHGGSIRPDTDAAARRTDPGLGTSELRGPSVPRPPPGRRYPT